MKKIGISIFIIVVVITCGICLLINKENSNLKKIKVAEVTHSIFYAPQYVAISKGYFKEVGLDVEIILTPGADKVMAAVLSNEVQIGLSGSEATIYVYNKGETNYVKTFAGLTNKDGSFIVGRTKEDNFTLENLKNKDVIGGRVGGMPEMTFEWVLSENGIDPKKDLNIDTSIAFPAMGGTFISGVGDYVTLFEPAATALEKQGLGYVLASVGELGGNVPYTAYNARSSFINDNKDVIESFDKAINKALDYVIKTPSKTIATDILEFFPDTSYDDMVKIIDRYKDINAWKTNTSISKEEFMLLQDIMKKSNELDKYVPYEDLIYTNNFKNNE